MAYSIADPHPDFGKDPNIINELGHTHYPKWVAAADGKRVLAKNEQEEFDLTGNVENPITAKFKKAKDAGWGDKDKK